jgi:hypothetical protein
MSVIVPQASRHYLVRMGLRPLFAMLIGLAMLFAPLGSRSGSAVAMAPPADHHARMMDSGHCGERPANRDHGKAPDKSCCVAMCAAVSVAPSASIEPPILPRSVQRPSLVRFNHSFLAELPTPPPRLG